MEITLFLLLGLSLASLTVGFPPLLSDDDKVLLFGLETEPTMKAARREKSLLNTFPFIDKINSAHRNDHNHAHEEHTEHHHHHPESSSLRRRVPEASNDLFPFKNTLRQNTEEDDQAGTEVGNSDAALDFNAVAEAADEDEDVASGRKCIDKVMMAEETVYDEVVTCDHSYDKRCHTSYVTNYASQQEEECEEHFKKSCYIAYEPLAFNETVEVCRTPIVKDCDIEGPAVCQTVYESECWTKQNVHEVCFLKEETKF